MVKGGDGCGRRRLTASVMLAPMARRLVLFAALALALAAVAVPATADAATTNARFMTRNVYLGASLTPGLQATSLAQLYEAAGAIFAEVKANKFGVRRKGLAAEIINKDPHLVGIQEGATWRTKPCDQPFTEGTIVFNFVKGLLTQLNSGKQRYRLVIAKPEFNFQIYADLDQNPETTTEGCPSGTEKILQLTMRDAIFAKVGVTTLNPKAGTFGTLLQVKVAGLGVDVTRGWTSTDAKIGNSKQFRFVNTHLEAFDNQASNHTNKNTDVGNGQVRAAQAAELFAQGGPAGPAFPRVVLLGDLNSDKNTPQKPGDGLAHKALLNNGFAERSTSNPFGCCLNSSLLTANGGGAVSDFDHKVDHIMARPGNLFTLLDSKVSGRQPVNGFWNSDHAGLYSKIEIP
jgi:endonuclease/exonuclease/phosphatase family metal-dependent hydrolase